MNKIFNFMTGGIIGALIGGVMILLMTPSSGEELRDTAQSRFDGFLSEVRQSAAQRRAELEAQLEDLKRGEAQ